jgi:hypothetical protein
MRPGETEREMVDRHLADGERIIVAQRALIARFEARGIGTTEPTALLGIFLGLQVLHQEHHDRLQIPTRLQGI